MPEKLRILRIIYVDVYMHDDDSRQVCEYVSIQVREYVSVQI